MVRGKGRTAPAKHLQKPSVPKASKKIKGAAGPPRIIDDQPFRWSIQDMDRDYNGKWDWDLSPHDARKLLEVIEDVTPKTWGEVKALIVNSKRKTHRLHHSQPVGTLCKEARNRLGELRIDAEELFRLRHGAKIRIWGHILNGVFRIIWYDREHKVCDSDD